MRFTETKIIRTVKLGEALGVGTYNSVEDRSLLHPPSPPTYRRHIHF